MDSVIDGYIHDHTTRENEVLAELYRETHLRVLNPRMLSGHVQGRFLEIISQMIRPKRILEIGTYTGYSAICLAKGLSENGILHTIEVNPELEEFAAKYFRLAGFENRIVQHIGNALEIIPHINEMFELVFIDAAKENYLDYYHLIFDKVKKGGFILADNALWDGKVVEKDNISDKETKGIKVFNEFIQQDIRVNNVIVSIRDGIMMVHKI